MKKYDKVKKIVPDYHIADTIFLEEVRGMVENEQEVVRPTDAEKKHKLELGLRGDGTRVEGQDFYEPRTNVVFESPRPTKDIQDIDQG